MSAKNGKPCGKCGNNEWHKSGGCVSCQRERNHRWHQRNLEKLKKKNRRWRQANPEKGKDKDRRWRQANPDKVREKSLRWLKANPEYHVANQHRRRARKTSAGGSYTAPEWRALVEHYGNKCLCCGRDNVKLTADHIVPIAKGGSSNIDNIQPLCGSCNSRKNDREIDYRPQSGLGRWIQRKLFG